MFGTAAGKTGATGNVKGMGGTGGMKESIVETDDGVRLCDNLFVEAGGNESAETNEELRLCVFFLIDVGGLSFDEDKLCLTDAVLV